MKTRRMRRGVGWGLAAVLAVAGAAAGAETNAPVPAASTNAAAIELSLTVMQAVLTALEHNPAIAVQRYNPAIQRTAEDQERAAFDPTLNGSASRQRTRSFALSSATNAITASTAESEQIAVSADTLLPTGTRLGLGGRTESDLLPTEDHLWGSRIGLTATQPLLNGFGTAVNLASLRQARLDTALSQYEFRGFVEAFVARVESAYWDAVLAEYQRDIYSVSLRLAGNQLTETQERIRLGKLAAVESAAAEAEVAARRETLINAESTLITARLNLLRLVSPGGTNAWQRVPVLSSAPTPPEPPAGGVEEAVAHALRLRPDLNQARLSIERSELEIVKTRNGLLPKMDLFVTLGRTGYADSFAESTRADIGNGYDTQVGVTLAYPLGNRAARAAHTRAKLSRAQVEAALDNLISLVQVDVRSAWVELIRTWQQVDATRTTRRLQEAKLLAETE